MSSMYDEYEGQIKQYIADGYNLKEIWKKLLEEEKIYGEYCGLYWFCRRRGIVANCKRICENCKYCDTYYVPDFDSNIRVCNKHKCQIRAKRVPRWCNDGFEKR